MKALTLCSRWSIVLAVAAVSCASRSPRPIRYGSLVAGERSFTYGHGVETMRLQNGLLVAMVPDARANLIAVDVRYLAGDIDDPDSRRGLAHVVEHMTFERRTEIGGPTVTEQLAATALSHNATTTWEATHYHTLALASELDALLTIEADRMSSGCGGLDHAAFARELAVVTQEVAERGPSELRDALLGELYGKAHGYTRRATEQDVAALTLADVCQFADAHYAPDRAILVIGGRFDAGVVRRALATRFAPITRRASVARVATTQAGLTGGTSEYRTETDEAAALVLFPAAPWGSAEAFDDALVDDLLVQALATLDHEQAWITGVDAGRLGGPRDGARYVALAVADPARLDDAFAEVFRAAGRIPAADSGLALGVLAARRRAKLFDDFESIDDRGARVADYLQLTHDRQFHLRELAALEAIDTDRLSARATRLTRASSRAVRLLPSAPSTPGTHQDRAPRPKLDVAADVIEAPVWQAPVDPAEADRPVALAGERRVTAVSETRLPNGLRLVMANDFTQPVIEARLVFPIGELGAGPGKLAIANASALLLEHDASLASLQDFATVNWALRLGARLSAEVDEHTTFTVRGSSTFADWHVWRLHWLLEDGTYDDDDVARVREAARRPITARDHDRSWRRALQGALFGADHPYAHGDARALAATLRVDDLDAFRAAHYRANGAALIIVGKFNAAAMTQTVTELFGAWSAAPPPPALPVPEMSRGAGPRWIAHADPEASQVRITLAFATTSPRDASRGARAIVGELVERRLAQVRTRLGASYGVGASYVMTEAGDAILIDGHVDAGRAGEVLLRMQADLAGLHTGDAALAADFVRARRTVLAHALSDPTKASSVADELEAAVAHGLAIDRGAALAATIAATTLADVRAVIAADLAPARRIAVLSGRPADTAAALAAAGVTTFQRVDDRPAAR